MKNLCSFFLFFMICCRLEMVAQTTLPKLELPADFTRISQPDELTTEGWYTIGGVNEDGQLVYMYQELTFGHKLKTVNSQAVPPQVQRFTNKQLIWRVHRLSESQLALQEAETGKYLTRKADGRLGFQWRTNLTDEARWNLRQTENKGFSLSDPSDAGRSIGLSTILQDGNTYYYFDNYEETEVQDLLFYKKAQKAVEVPGHVDLPADGQRLVWFDQERIRTKAGTAVSVRDYALLDGTLAPGTELDVWTCRLHNNQHFVLERDGQYCNYDLQPGGEPSEWQIFDGYICTVEAEPRYLCYEPSEGTWRLMSADEARNMAHWAAIADAPRRNVNEQGICFLSGGWSAVALAALEWDGVRGLDLTALSLPVFARTFISAPQPANIPIYVSETAAKHVPSDWNFVVSCGAQNCLLRHTLLADRQPFYTDRDFLVEAGQMEYRREAGDSDDWQTLCLPFSASPRTVSIASCTSYAEGELHFDAADEIRAGYPYLVKAGRNQPWVLTSNRCMISAEPSDVSVFQGTYTDLTIQDGQIRHYLLSEDGTSFDEAAPASHLASFRVYLRLTPSKSSSSLHIKVKK